MSEQTMHTWIYVIIPSGAYNHPMFCAFCKGCRQYFTEILDMASGVGDDTFRFTQGNLPKFGCTVDDESLTP